MKFRSKFDSHLFQRKEIDYALLGKKYQAEIGIRYH